MRKKMISCLLAGTMLACSIQCLVPLDEGTVQAKEENAIENVNSVDELAEAMAGAGMVTQENTDTDDENDCDRDDRQEPDSTDSTYRLKRIILFADHVDDTYGATDIICYDKYDYYVFGFDTEQNAEDAYEKMRKDYGDDCCMPDEVMYACDMLAGSDDTYTAVGWGTEYMGMDELKVQTEDYGMDLQVDVAVIDTGINPENELFKGRIDTVNSKGMYDTENVDDYVDTLGHGSHVAGIIADATPDNVKLTILKCFSDSGTTSCSIIQQGIMEALDLNVDIINMSFCFYGANAGEDTRAAIDKLIDTATSKNIAMCVAAGNLSGGGLDVQDNSYPADREDVITVSALKKISGVQSSHAVIDKSTVEFDSSYSYYGEKIDFAAPGTSILSAGAGSGNIIKSGTSMATPYIAAAAAYVKMAEPELTNEDLVARLASCSVDLGDSGRDILYGYGCPYMADYFNKVQEMRRAEDAGKAPGACAVRSVTNTSLGINISWNAVDGADCYRIYRKEAGKGYICIAQTTGSFTLSYLDKSAVKGTYYRYAVKAVRGGKLGTIANTYLTIRLAQPNVASKNVYGGIKVAWSNVAGATGYRIYRKKAGASGWTAYKNFPAGTCSFIDTSVSGCTSYTYTVKAYHSYVWSSYKLQGTTAYRMPDCTFSSIRSDSARIVDVKWKLLSGVTGYQLQRCYDVKFNNYRSVTLGKSVSARRMKYLTSGKYCYVRIRCYRKTAGTTYFGAWSRTIKIKVR